MNTFEIAPVWVDEKGNTCVRIAEWRDGDLHGIIEMCGQLTASEIVRFILIVHIKSPAFNVDSREFDRAVLDL